MNSVENTDNLVLNKDKNVPLAHRLRPATFEDVFGQDHLLKSNGIISNLLNGSLSISLLFWGPPGSGKTSIARLFSKSRDYHFVQISAIFSGVADLKKIFTDAARRKEIGITTLLFIDEIHRFNKFQQDSLLPVIEDGTVICIGATTENPSFDLNSALLSRMQLIKFLPHNYDSLSKILLRAEQIMGQSLPLTDDARDVLLNLADGDARMLLSISETIWSISENDKKYTAKELEIIFQKRAPIYDKNKEAHYNLISALHKSIRGSDPDAALYYFSRMIEGGEDPMFIARRLVRVAVEDIGLADPQALVVANAAKDAYNFLGSPEGELALANVCVYLATAPKSNAVYKAYNNAMEDARRYGSLMPPKTILNAPNKFMRQQGYGEGYIYDAETKYSFSGQEYFPESMGRKSYYHPKDWGFEKEINKRLLWWSKLRDKLNSK